MQSQFRIVQLFSTLIEGKCFLLGSAVIKVMAITRDGNGKHLHVGFQLNLWPIFNYKTHLWKL